MKTSKENVIKRICNSAAVLLALACSAPAYAAPIAESFLWLAERGNERMLVLGAVHDVPRDVADIPPHVIKAVQTASALRHERHDKQSTSTAVFTAAFIKPDAERSDRNLLLNAAAKARLAQLIARGVLSREQSSAARRAHPVGALGSVSWAIIQHRTSQSLDVGVFKPEGFWSGHDAQLVPYAVSLGKDVSPIEPHFLGIDYWMVGCHTIEIESDILIASIDAAFDDDFNRLQYGGLARLLSSGNVDAYVEAVAARDQKYPIDRLLHRCLGAPRNIAWGKQIEMEFANNSSFFPLIVVGSGHLVAPKSFDADGPTLLQVLEGMSFKLTRIRNVDDFDQFVGK